MKIGLARVTFVPFIRLLALVAACIALLTGLASAAAFAASPSPAPSDLRQSVLKVGFSTDIDGVNPFVSYSSITWEAFHLCYDFLTWYDQDYRPVPDLATSWTHSPDGKVWTFKIRQGGKWQDDVPLTARDVAFTYNYILKNNLSFYMSYLANVTKVEAPDDSTVVITSSKPNPMMLALYIPILPEHLWSKINGKTVIQLSNVPTIGSGPYRIAAVEKGRYLEMTVNNDYWGRRPAVKTILFQVYATEDDLVQDYKKGNLDVADFQQPVSLRAVAHVSGSKTVAVPAIGFNMLGVNCWKSPKSKGNPLLRDVRIRQAIAWAIDTTKINLVSMGGKAQVGTSVLSPAMGEWHWQPPAGQTYTYDPAKARQILDDAGYKLGPGGVRVAPNGKRLDFTLNALSDYPAEVTAAKLISQYLEDVGIGTRLDIVSQAAFNDRIYGNGGVDLYVWNWAGEIDPGYQLSAFITSQCQNNNDSCYSNPTYDELFVEQGTTVDRPQRVDIVHHMEQILYNDCPYVILSYNTNLEAYRADRWTGWQLAPKSAPAPIENYLIDTYMSLKPAVVAPPTRGGLGTGAILAIAAGAAVVVGVVVWLVRRRRPKETESA